MLSGDQLQIVSLSLPFRRQGVVSLFNFNKEGLQLFFYLFHAGLKMAVGVILLGKGKISLFYLFSGRRLGKMKRLVVVLLLQRKIGLVYFLARGRPLFLKNRLFKGLQLLDR